MQLFQYGQREIDHLTRRDKKLGRAIGHIGMIERHVAPDLFKALVHSVVAQYMSFRSFMGYSNDPPNNGQHPERA